MSGKLDGTDIGALVELPDDAGRLEMMATSAFEEPAVLMELKPLLK